MLGCSPKKITAKNILKNTCTCIINDAIPEVIPTYIPIKIRANCKANMTKPYKTTILKGTPAGGFTKNTTGMLDKKKRRVQSNSGENSCSPNFTKIKFNPQITTTSKVNKR